MTPPSDVSSHDKSAAAESMGGTECMKMLQRLPGNTRRDKTSESLPALLPDSLLTSEILSMAIAVFLNLAAEGC